MRPTAERNHAVMTYQIAMAIGRDAANKAAKAAGRTVWNESDWNIAATLVAKLLGQET